MAKELGWSEPVVTQFKQIKERLHPRAWTLARNGFAKTQEVPNQPDEAVANQEFAIVNWRESLTKTEASVKDGENEFVNPKLTIVNQHETHFQALLVLQKWEYCRTHRGWDCRTYFYNCRLAPVPSPCTSQAFALHK